MEKGLCGSFGNVGLENGILVFLNSQVKKALRGELLGSARVELPAQLLLLQEAGLHPACLDKGVLQVMLTGVTNNLHSGHQPPWSGVFCCSVSDIKVKAQ